MSSSRSPRAGHRAVMVVDDDDAIREVFTAVLEVEGYPVIAAADGAEALSLLRKGQQPGLILLDLRMPGMDGRTFLHEKESDPQLSPIAVLILSGDRDGSQIATALGYECVTKPVDLDRLVAIVKTFCQS